MPKHDKISDENMRSLFIQARGEMAEAKGTEAVHTLSYAFVSLLKMKPEITNAEAKPGAEYVAKEWTEVFSAELQWPRLGANLIPESIEAGDPKIEFEADQFSISEAMMYYEFAIDTAIQYEV